MQKVTLLVNDLKSLPDSNDPKKKEYVANVSVLELAKANIPTDANPRKQDQKSRVFKEIKESILSFDNIFRYKNNGVFINCSSVVFDNDKAKPIELSFNLEKEELKHGILNGGHTVLACKEAYAEILSSIENGEASEDELTKLQEQSVQVRMVTGLTDLEEIVEIADAANTSVGVTTESFIEMSGGFEGIKSKLRNSLWNEKIQFKMNDKMETDEGLIDYPIDVKELLALIWAVNSDMFPTDGYDKALVKPYSSKGSLVNRYENEDTRNEFEISSPKLKALLTLRDFILVSAESVYKAGKGRSDFHLSRISSKFSKNDVVDIFDYEIPKVTLNRGAMLPILSSFRVFEELDSFQFDIMKDAWLSDGYKLMQRCEMRLKDLDSITELGKNIDTWKDCANLWDGYIRKNMSKFK